MVNVQPPLSELDAEMLARIDEARPLAVGLHSEHAEMQWEHRRHTHNKGLLFYTRRGILNCELEDGVWIVPPQCVVWIPPNMPHASSGSASVETCLVFIASEAASRLPEKCCTFSASILLRELLLRASDFSNDYEVDSPEARLIATMMDELAIAPIEHLHLPMPRDARLRRLASLILDSPDDKAGIDEWASRVGLSRRTMSRLVVDEVGMSFGQWRRQLYIFLALQRLGRGESVKKVALELGYDSTSSFVTMFKKVLGKPPARYLSDRVEAAR